MVQALAKGTLVHCAGPSAADTQAPGSAGAAAPISEVPEVSIGCDTQLRCCRPHLSCATYRVHICVVQPPECQWNRAVSVACLQGALVLSTKGMQGRLRMPASIYNANWIGSCREVQMNLLIAYFPRAWCNTVQLKLHCSASQRIHVVDAPLYSCTTGSSFKSAGDGDCTPQRARL